MPNHTIHIVRAETLIPLGPYCYSRLPDRERDHLRLLPRTKPCPFWGLDAAALAVHEPQAGGYCRYLKQGDWMVHGTSLLWDRIKECGIKEGDEA